MTSKHPRLDATRAAAAQSLSLRSLLARCVFSLVSIQVRGTQKMPFASESPTNDRSRRARPRYCVGPTVDSDHSCSLASTLDERSVGFSTRRDDPSNSEFSSIDNDR